MTTPLEIHFHGLEKSDAVEARIRERYVWLATRFDRMTHCRVLVEAPNRNEHRGKLVHIKLDVGIPGQNPLVINSEKPVSEAQADILRAVRDAFATARRRLDEAAAKLSGRTRNERGRRRPAPTPSREMPSE